MNALSAWLDRIYTIRSGPEIEMGLERIRPVFDAMKIAPSCPVFLVGGTNGKGSVCAYIDAMLRAAGYTVARYTSPHIHRFNERVVLNGVEASDEQLVAAFEAVEVARAACGNLALTFCEDTTLAAFHVFSQSKLNAWVIEVGLGGRLDATNILDPDCSVIVSIGLDHTDFLGPTREHIAREKTGILRANKPAVIAEPDPPQSLRDAVTQKKANAMFVGKDFGWQRYEAMPTQWGFWVGAQRRHGLPIPALRGNYQLGNAAAALAALHTLSDTLPVSQGAIRQGLLEVDWPARFQVLPGRPTVVLDVAHNEHAARALEQALSDMAYFPETYAVFAMLKDKDIAAVVAAVKHRIDHWHIAPLPGARGVTVETLEAALLAAGVKDRAIQRFNTVADAYAAARESADEADRIVVFGSFLTVAACSA
ncbi:MAG: bifunctional tetrahydrofolate synthase/dihydrofolate synthase [Casimicrobium sp.]